MAETPDPKFYQKQIDAQEKQKEKLQGLSYSSSSRGYVLDGKVISEAERTAEIKKLDSKIKSLQADQKKFGKYGPGFGEGAKSNETGEEFLRLYRQATAIKVKDYDSSIANLEAWTKVKEFVDSNSNIRVVVNKKINDGLFSNLVDAARTVGVAPGKVSAKNLKTAIDVKTDPSWKKSIEITPRAAAKTATEWAEKDTVRMETVTKGDNPNTATKSTRRTVIDEEKLSARQLQIDGIVARQPVPVEVQQKAGSKVVPTPVTTAAKKVGTPATAAKPKTTAPNRKRIGDVDTIPDTKTTTTPPVVPPVTPPGGGGGGGGTGGRKVGDTRTNSKGVNFTWTGKGWKRTATMKGQDTSSEAWKTTIQEEFGSLWDVYNENADVKKVIDQSVKEGWYNDRTQLEEKLKNTNWFRTTESSARQYKILQSTDPATAEANLGRRVEEVRQNSLVSGVVLSDTTLRKVAEDSLKFGWTTQQIANAVGSEGVATAKQGGATGLADLRRGATGTNLRGIADSYGIKLSDTMLDQYVAEVLQGTKTDVQFTDLMKQQASTMYRSLAPQIEKGIDVKTATSMYTNTAQSVLGVDPSTIDWTQDKWNKALNYQDPKTNEYRQMDSYEWNRYLRSLPEWQETDDAKSVFRRAAFTLAQSFGKTS